MMIPYLFGIFRLKSRQTKEEGFVSADEQIQMEGAHGTAGSDLRPAGIAIINDERVDVTTRGEYIRKGAPIQVIKIKGSKIVVKAIDEGFTR